jgi:hypothetical protein
VYLKALIETGEEIAEISASPNISGEPAVDAVLAAMRDGAEVIYRGAFLHGGWTGYADFLHRVDERRSDLGSWSYEVADTKLARRTTPGEG